MVLDAAFEPIEAVMKGLTRELGETAARGDKLAPQVELEARLSVRRSHAAKLRGMLVLLLTNAVDHGLEPADEREAAGKSPAGRVQLDATRTDAGQLALRISDDGRGLSLNALRGKLEDGQALDAVTAESMIFAPGMSTSAEVTLTSGRGMGLDAVAEAARAWGGSLRLVFLDPAEPRAESGFARVAFELTVSEGIVHLHESELQRVA